MNKKINILEFGKFIEESNCEKFMVGDIYWKFQDAAAHSILFYKCHPDDNIEEKITQLENVGTIVVAFNVKRAYDQFQGRKILTSNKNWLEFQKALLDLWYPMPQGIKLMGVTGTNGKTSTCYYAHQILTQNKKSSLYCGTLGVYAGEHSVHFFGLTSPAYIDIRKLMHAYQKTTYFIFELSSHALYQDRFYKLKFDAIGWTNFTQDHLDYHETMEEYFKAKMLVKNLAKENVPITIPSFEEELISKVSLYCKTKAAAAWNPNWGDQIKLDINKRNFSLAIQLVGDLLKETPVVDFKKIHNAYGRAEIIYDEDFKVIVDYAHTPDALANICRELKNSFKTRLITVFGCGGDRDKIKRPLMAQAVEAHSDYVVLTSDNPRYENPQQIILDAEKGFMNPMNRISILDRRDAIKYAIAMAEQDDIILIAGKGHEPFIDIKGTKYPYNDKEYILGLLYG